MPFTLTSMHGSIDKAKSDLKLKSKLSSDAKDEMSKHVLRISAAIIKNTGNVCANADRKKIQLKDVETAVDMMFPEKSRTLKMRATKANQKNTILAQGKVKQILQNLLVPAQAEYIYTETVVLMQDVMTNLIKIMLKESAAHAANERQRATIVPSDVLAARQKLRGC